MIGAGIQPDSDDDVKLFSALAFVAFVGPFLALNHFHIHWLSQAHNG
jgi:hypothetical protein